MSTRVFLNRYRLLSELGTGATGRVFECEDTQLGRRVAVKTLKPRHELAGKLSIEEYAGIQGRLKEEALKAARVQHPSIATVFDVEEQDGETFIIYEFIQGPTLERWALTADMSYGDVATIGERLADALDHMHRRNVTHCDVKPNNILLRDATDASRSPMPVLVDLGSGRTLTRAADEYGIKSLEGTFPYSSPEQQHGYPLTEASDIYNLGMVLYQLLTRQRVTSLRPGPSESEWVGLEQPLEWDKDTPAPLREICERCVSYEVGKRYPASSYLRDDLRSWISRQPADEPTVFSTPDYTLIADHLATIIVVAMRGFRAVGVDALKEYVLRLDDFYPQLKQAAPAAAQRLLRDLIRSVFGETLPDLSIRSMAAWVHTQPNKTLLNDLCELGMTDSWLPREASRNAWKQFATKNCAGLLADRIRRLANSEEEFLQAESLFREVRQFIQEEIPVDYNALSSIEYGLGQSYVTRGEANDAIEMFEYSGRSGKEAGNRASVRIAEFKILLAKYQFELVPAYEAKAEMETLLASIERVAKKENDETAARFIENIANRLFQVVYDLGISASGDEREPLTEQAQHLHDRQLTTDWTKRSATSLLTRLTRLQQQARLHHLCHNLAGSIHTFALYLESSEKVSQQADLVEFSQKQPELAREYRDLGRVYSEAGQLENAQAAWKRGLSLPEYEGNLPIQQQIQRELDTMGRAK